MEQLEKRLLRVLAIGAAVLALMSAAPAFGVDDIGVFELEGDALDNPAVPGDDWQTVNAGAGAGVIVARTGGNVAGWPGVIADPAPKSIFSQGGSKDPNDISDWRWKDGSVPDKDDITNAYAAAYNVQDELVIYFGADRFANDGDAQLGFWFFQEDITLNPDGTFGGLHQVGDLLVLAEFSQGGSVGTIQVLEWVGTGGDQKGGTLQLLHSSDAAECGAGQPGYHEVCAILNQADDDPTAPWPYIPKSGPAGQFPVASFFEGGINISRIFGASGEVVPCFASFLVETRSSTSVTAQLKDFVLSSFPVCGIDVTKTCANPVLNEAGDAIIYTIGGTVTNSGFGTLFDMTLSDEPPADISFVSCADPTAPVDPPAALNPGDSVCYTGTFSTVQNGPMDTVTVTAVGSAGVSVSDAATAMCPNLQLQPNILVTKACSTVLDVVNNLVVVKTNISGDVCNTGDTPLNQVEVADDKAGPLLSGLTLVPGQIGEPGVCESFTSSYYPTGVNSTNPAEAVFSDTVTASGVAPLNLGIVVDTATAHCSLCP